MALDKLLGSVDYFAVVPRWLHKNKAMPHLAVRLFCCLSDRRNYATGVVWVGQRTINADTGLSFDSIQTHIETLREAGALAVHRSRKVDGTKAVNIYRVNLNPGEVTDAELSQAIAEAGGVPEFQKWVLAQQGFAEPVPLSGAGTSSGEQSAPVPVSGIRSAEQKDTHDNDTQLELVAAPSVLAVAKPNLSFDYLTTWWGEPATDKDGNRTRQGNQHAAKLGKFLRDTGHPEPEEIERRLAIYCARYEYRMRHGQPPQLMQFLAAWSECNDLPPTVNLPKVRAWLGQQNGADRRAEILARAQAAV